MSAHFITARDLSPTDIAALTELRLRRTIRIDLAGGRLEALQRLTRAGVLSLDDAACDVTVAALTDLQRELGFKANGGTGPGGERYCWAPTWVWDRARAEEAAALLRTVEGRRPVDLEWKTFLRWTLKVWTYNAGPTIERAAQRFELAPLDMVDVVDSYYWAYRVPHDGRPIEQQTIELEGE